MTQQKANTFVEEMRDTARQVWLAGLGGIAAVEDGATRMFRNLVDRGQEFEARSGERVKRTVEGAQGSVKKAWDRVERSFDQRVADVLDRLQVASRDDVVELSQKIDRLGELVEKLQTKKGARRKAPAKKKPPQSGPA